MTTRAIVRIPAAARRGEIFQIRTLIAHPMETGFRRSQTGEPLPRDIITQLVCTYNGAEIMRADFYPAITANPAFAFTTIATDSGTIECRWSGDNGFAAAASAQITVA